MDIIKVAQLMLGMGVDTDDVEKAQSKLASFGEKTMAVGRSISTYVTLPILAAGGAMIKAAADAEEMQAKFDSVFPSTGNSVVDRLGEFAVEANRSTIELQGMAATLGDVLKPLGFTESGAADLSVQLTELAADLSSFNNMPMDEALARLRGTLVGSHENALAFGVVINENTLKAEMAAKGWDKLTGKELELAKVQARINLLMQGTSDAQGDAIRTAGSFTNELRGLLGRLTDVGAQLGAYLIPALTWLVDKMSAAVTWFGDLDEKGQKMVLVLGGVAAAIGPLTTIVGALALSFGKAATSGGVFAAVMGTLTAPVTLIVAGIALAVAAIAAAYIYWDDIVFWMLKGWLSFKIGFLEAVGDILAKAESWVNMLLEVMRPLGEFLGIDMPEQISIGTEAVRKSVLDAKMDLNILEESHRLAKQEAKRLQEEQSKIEVPDLSDSNTRLGGLKTSASDAATEVGNLSTNLAGVPTPDVDPIIGELDRIKPEGLDPLVAGFGQMAADADKATAVIGTELLREGGSLDKIMDGAEDLFVDENGMIRYVKDFAGESERILDEELVSYMQEDFVAGFGAALGDSGVGGAIKHTATLFAGGGPESVKSALGNVIGRLVGVGDTTVQGAMGTAFSSIAQGGSVTSAITGLISSIPGIGTAFLGVDAILQTFGINIQGVIGGIMGGIRDVIGLTETTRGDVLATIETTVRRHLALGDSAGDALATIGAQFAETMDRWDISTEDLREMVQRVFGMSDDPMTWLGSDLQQLIDEFVSGNPALGIDAAGSDPQAIFDAITGNATWGLGNLSALAEEFGMTIEEVMNALAQVLGLPLVFDQTDYSDVIENLVEGLVAQLAAEDLDAPWETIYGRVLEQLQDPFFLGSLGVALDNLGARAFGELLERIGSMLGLSDSSDESSLTDWMNAIMDLLGQLSPITDPTAAGRLATSQGDGFSSIGPDGFVPGAGYTQHINVYLDNRLIAEGVVPHLPEFLDLYGIA